jgi:predicted dehydrogenase
VLCETPPGLNAAIARTLLQARDRCGVKIGEAFMVRTHPQGLRARELIHTGRMGELRSAAGYFGYSASDPASGSNRAATGGGAIMDIGCYPIKISRFIFGARPRRVAAPLERDPEMNIDRLCSVILEFPSGQCISTAGTQVAYCQKMQFFGTKGRIDVEVRFTPPLLTRRRAFSSKAAQICMPEEALSSNRFRRATSSRFRGTNSQKRFAAPAGSPIRCKLRFAIWR